MSPPSDLSHCPAERALISPSTVLEQTETTAAQNWISDLCRSDLFEVIITLSKLITTAMKIITLNADQQIQGLRTPLYLDNDMTSKVNMLLAFAYDTRDMHLGELFNLLRLHRRTVHALELQRATLHDMRKRISMDYSQLNQVKEVLKEQGFVDAVNDFAKARECPLGNIPPVDMAFVYKYNGTIPCILPHVF
jgi:hypothetical protein